MADQLKGTPDERLERLAKAVTGIQASLYRLSSTQA